MLGLGKPTGKITLRPGQKVTLTLQHRGDVEIMEFEIIRTSRVGLEMREIGERYQMVARLLKWRG